MDVGVARAVQLYNDANWDKGLNTTHADGRLTIRVARQTSATLPLWSTWQLQGHLPERIVRSLFPKLVSRETYDVHFLEAKLKDVDYDKGRCKQWFCMKIPSLQWLTQAPIQALKFWFATPNAGELVAKLSMELRGAHYQTSTYKWDNFGHRIRTLYRLDDKDHGAILDIFTSINEIITKAVSHIENSGGYNIILKPSAKYAIKNGVLSWKPNAKISRMESFSLRLFGTWWSKDVKITRKDGLDGIFIPI